MWIWMIWNINDKDMEYVISMGEYEWYGIRMISIGNMVYEWICMKNVICIWTAHECIVYDL